MSSQRFLELLVDSQNFRKSFLSEMASSRFDTFRLEMLFRGNKFENDIAVDFFIINEPDLLDIKADIITFR